MDWWVNILRGACQRTGDAPLSISSKSSMSGASAIAGRNPPHVPYYSITHSTQYVNTYLSRD
jgi:hypothetical protein